MGPRSFERGNNLSLTGNITLAAALQWGRAHSSAEIPSVRLRDRRNVQCFNGAALIRARKLVPVLIRRPLAQSFNGAALIRARKSRTRRLPGRALLSFNGAALIRARKSVATRHGRAEGASCFNGAALIRARKCVTSGEEISRARCFNGAALIRARKSNLCKSAKSVDALLQWGRAHSSAEIALTLA